MPSREDLRNRVERLRELARNNPNPHEALAARRAADQLVTEHHLEETTTCPTCGHRAVRTEPKKITDGRTQTTSLARVTPKPIPPRQLMQFDREFDTKPPAQLMNWVDGDERKTKQHDFAFPFVHLGYK